MKPHVSSAFAPLFPPRQCTAPSTIAGVVSVGDPGALIRDGTYGERGISPLCKPSQRRPRSDARDAHCDCDDVAASISACYACYCAIAEASGNVRPLASSCRIYTSGSWSPTQQRRC